MKLFTYIDFLAYMGIGSAHPGGFKLTEKILKGENISQEQKLLDVGCGTGITASYIAKEIGGKVTAIDLHPEMIKKARRRIEQEHLPIHLIQANAEALPFDQQSYDYVLTESVTAFTTIPNSLQEYFRVLKKNGVLILLEMTTESDLTNEEKEEIQQLYGINEVLSKQEWITKLQKAGFHSIEILYTGNPQEQLNTEIKGEVLDQQIPVFEPSEYIDPLIYGIWTEHEIALHKYATKLGHCVFRAIR